MDEYFSDEKLCDFYKCEYCGQTNKNSVKKTKIWRAPENLILHLKTIPVRKQNHNPNHIPGRYLKHQSIPQQLK
jgi:ubiquitin C-terminal hydrolase